MLFSRFLEFLALSLLSFRGKRLIGRKIGFHLIDYSMEFLTFSKYSLSWADDDKRRWRVLRKLNFSVGLQKGLWGSCSRRISSAKMSIQSLHKDSCDILMLFDDKYLRGQGDTLQMMLILGISSAQKALQ
jgi:hypothetical protein